eukprot:6669876-Pyramimonas_sp.AAC.1
MGRWRYKDSIVVAASRRTDARGADSRHPTHRGLEAKLSLSATSLDLAIYAPDQVGFRQFSASGCPHRAPGPSTKIVQDGKLVWGRGPDLQGTICEQMIAPQIWA